MISLPNYEVRIALAAYILRNRSVVYALDNDRVVYYKYCDQGLRPFCYVISKNKSHQMETFDRPCTFKPFQVEAPSVLLETFAHVDRCPDDHSTFYCSTSTYGVVYRVRIPVEPILKAIRLDQPYLVQLVISYLGYRVEATPTSVSVPSCDKTEQAMARKAARLKSNAHKAEIRKLEKRLYQLEDRNEKDRYVIDKVKRRITKRAREQETLREQLKKLKT